LVAAIVASRTEHNNNAIEEYHVGMEESAEIMSGMRTLSSDVSLRQSQGILRNSAARLARVKINAARSMARTIRREETINCIDSHDAP
jgi:hypothetical protein